MPPLIFGDHSRSPISPRTQHASVFVRIFSPEVRVGPFMPENTAKGVSLNTFATKHPAIQCSVQTSQQRSSGVKPKGNSTQVSGPSQPASNPRQGGTA